MQEGAWVVLGTLIGSAGTLVTTWLSEHLKRQSPYPRYDRAVKALLKTMLENGPQWRRLETLANVAGLSSKDAKEYLIEIGARASENDAGLWGLVSRNPLPTGMAQG